MGERNWEHSFLMRLEKDRKEISENEGDRKAVSEAAL